MSIENLFGPIISQYTDEDGVRDGVLHHLWPERWPWLLVTETVYSLCEQESFIRGDVDVLVPLVMDAIMETQRQHRFNPKTTLVELEHTAIGTVWIRPNGKGGMTIMKPEDN